MSTTTPDLESASAQEVIAYAIERFHPRLKTACSFQKEETVLAHMLSEIAPDAKLFTIDTGVLFPETLQTWKRFEERFALPIEVIDASSPGAPWTQTNCCSAAKVDGLERALSDLDAWITGIRREQATTRAAAPKLERDERRGIWKLNPLADWSDKDLWAYITRHELPYHPLHDRGYASIGCSPCTQPGSGRDGRWAGEDKTECGIHL
jgi:phosphoadenosine phosphosulfate reductase